jgi:arsenate reductase
MSLRVYTYEKCSTCRKAVSFLNERNIPHQVIPIRERPPTMAELRTMLDHVGELRRLFNTSGLDYRAMKLSERLPAMSLDEALSLLAKNGNLVKRPFALTAKSGTVGFNEADWARLFA